MLFITHVFTRFFSSFVPFFFFLFPFFIHSFLCSFVSSFIHSSIFSFLFVSFLFLFCLFLSCLFFSFLLLLLPYLSIYIILWAPFIFISSFSCRLDPELPRTESCILARKISVGSQGPLNWRMMEALLSCKVHPLAGKMTRS